jgi:AcrR family transcriptional regulator
MSVKPRTREAARSREAILAAAETILAAAETILAAAETILAAAETILAAAENLFARSGFDRITLAGIGQAAGLSRQAPAYFFGDKERLYAAVLERVFAAHQERLGASAAMARGGQAGKSWMSRCR